MSLASELMTSGAPISPTTVSAVDLGYYTQAEICALTSLSPVTIWRRIKDGEFPKNVKLSAKRVGWPRAKIHEWMRRREELADAS